MCCWQGTQRLGVFKYRVLRNKCVSGREDAAESWNQLHLSSYTDTYSSSNILRGDRMEEEMGMACNMYGREKKCVQVSGGET
jgi:hypothetical protein